jgi:hypothetical protein
VPLLSRWERKEGGVAVVLVPAEPAALDRDKGTFERVLRSLSSLSLLFESSTSVSTMSFISSLRCCSLLAGVVVAIVVVVVLLAEGGGTMGTARAPPVPVLLLEVVVASDALLSFR